jgi:hypothetical protein
MFGSFLPEPWFGFGTTKSTQVAGADIVMKSQAHAQGLCHVPAFAKSAANNLSTQSLVSGASRRSKMQTAPEARGRSRQHISSSLPR